MSDDFKAGDVVQLKSGGNRDRIWCVWFDAKTKTNDNFAPHALKHAEKADWTGELIRGE
jgi:uncharacterized protein YodC (DUF2158 family)